MRHRNASIRPAAIAAAWQPIVLLLSRSSGSRDSSYLPPTRGSTSTSAGANVKAIDSQPVGNHERVVCDLHQSYGLPGTHLRTA